MASAAGAEFFGIEPEVVGVSEQFFEQQLGFFQLMRARASAFDEPERAGGKAAFDAGEAVDVASSPAS